MSNEYIDLPREEIKQRTIDSNMRLVINKISAAVEEGSFITHLLLKHAIPEVKAFLSHNGYTYDVSDGHLRIFWD
jgi:hypothetical protein